MACFSSKRHPLGTSFRCARGFLSGTRRTDRALGALPGQQIARQARSGTRERLMQSDVTFAPITGSGYVASQHADRGRDRCVCQHTSHTHHVGTLARTVRLRSPHDLARAPRGRFLPLRYANVPRRSRHGAATHRGVPLMMRQQRSVSFRIHAMPLCPGGARLSLSEIA